MPDWQSVYKVIVLVNRYKFYKFFMILTLKDKFCDTISVIFGYNKMYSKIKPVVVVVIGCVVVGGSVGVSVE